MRLLEALCQRFHQVPLRTFLAVAQDQSQLDMLDRQFGDVVSLDLPEIAPDQVIEWAGAVCDTPVSHDAIRIEGESSLKAFDSFFLIEAQAPFQAEIEP